MVYSRYIVDITIGNGVYKPTYNWGAPSCTEILAWFSEGNEQKKAMELVSDQFQECVI